MDQSFRHEPEYIVHHHTGEESTPPSTSELLTQGLIVLNFVSKSAGWVNVSSKCDVSVFDSRGNLFQFSTVAPHVGRTTSSQVSDILLEWGSQGNETSEVFCVDDLEEFCSTNLDGAIIVQDPVPRDSLASAETPLYSSADRYAAIGNVYEELQKGSMIDQDDPPPAHRRRIDTETLLYSSADRYAANSNVYEEQNGNAADCNSSSPARRRRIHAETLLYSSADRYTDAGNVHEKLQKTKAWDHDGPPPAKCRRIDAGSLWKIVPQPHFYTTFGLKCDPHPPAVHNFTFKSANSQPIAPYTDETYRAHFQDEYARCAWVIPIRGTLPWSQCTTASILAPEVENNSPPKPMTVNDNPSSEIVWTLDAVRDFWKFLIDLRSAGRLGPIGLSFHATPASQHIPSVRTTLPRLSTYPRSTTEHKTSASTQKTSQTPMHCADHFKVYHDATQAIHLRNVLDAWAFTYREGGEHDGVKKIRVLKGCILVLVNESSQGILTC